MQRGEDERPVPGAGLPRADTHKALSRSEPGLVQHRLLRFRLHQTAGGDPWARELYWGEVLKLSLQRRGDKPALMLLFSQSR